MVVKSDLAAMQAAVNHINSVKGQLDAEINNVETLCQGIRTAWEGQAKGSFDKVMADFQNANNKMNQALDEFATQIKETQVGYTEQEQRAQDAIMNTGASSGLGDGLGLNSSLKI
ncbi:WXG100 family type VII secretion target [Nocardia cyriacigeorgica]|uniref:Putative esxB culture filtrate protein n=1 Tax=Nocardia cyriacigeorgica (strain GUH-2) TaxID=1127134 RepID=H6R0S7_NOCCG|nr:WXG100 family type VII secretion target [Nocardia cyriacigeorgica]BDT85115.1 hypothetical protein FMUAM8_08790 [Nocardia cyriacigeorgica]CCF61701.1 putative esxB culture filtrate protein [Nocardia cyriacigeorgica GUH-2]